MRNFMKEIYRMELEKLTSSTGTSFTVTSSTGYGTQTHTAYISIQGTPSEIINWSDTLGLGTTGILSLTMTDDIATTYVLSTTLSSSGTITLSATGTRTLTITLKANTNPGSSNNVTAAFSIKDSTNTTSLSPDGNFSMYAIGN